MTQNKKYLILSFVFLGLSCLLAMHYFLPYMQYPLIFRRIIIIGCWLLSGFSLFFCRGIRNKLLKVIVIGINIFCIYGWWIFY
ncbi:hypothetical protein IGJ19_000621 [Enterococcus sp. DIV1368b]|uniref:Uncharacterized protein n=1 Tax=Enterococcus mundtii TaxID=53346 RepID=A0A242KY04_ENTMU|nr:hypothetical protein EM4838_02040 [Enterococcus mundtii]OTP26450.1 hypothetical protein A5802_000161 [Enterococcus mundtii]PTO34524.1 hypothetical protein C6P50_14800 [Enterococcus mundtii]RYT03979.1 hypothetical protein EAI87_07435 [Enterococcus mundtii]